MLSSCSLLLTKTAYTNDILKARDHLQRVLTKNFFSARTKIRTLNKKGCQIATYTVYLYYKELLVILYNDDHPWHNMAELLRTWRLLLME